MAAFAEHCEHARVQETCSGDEHLGSRPFRLRGVVCEKALRAENFRELSGLAGRQARCACDRLDVVPPIEKTENRLSPCCEPWRGEHEIPWDATRCARR